MRKHEVILNRPTLAKISVWIKHILHQDKHWYDSVYSHKYSLLDTNSFNSSHTYENLNYDHYLKNFTLVVQVQFPEYLYEKVFRNISPDNFSPNKVENMLICN